MVLFKRKPVQFLSRPSIEDEATECWIIPETQEVFVTYESYLQRMDWYKARKFICEISGHSGLSFFDALKSETAGARDVESAFPEPLKQPVLRKIQFSTVSRIDNLVDQVYDEFKNDYFPKEQVIVTLAGERQNGTIREKATFSELRDSNTGEVTREAFTRYLVRMEDGDEGDKLVDDVEVSRDRKAFTKQMLRSFIKNSVTREAWTGAPWLVKQSVAQFYQIDTNVPIHLQHSHKVAEKKERKKAEQQDGMFGVWPTNKLPELKPAHAKGGRKSQQLTQEQIDEYQRAQWEEYHRQQQQMMQQDPAYAQHFQGQQSPSLAYQNGYPQYPHGQFPVQDGPPPGFPNVQHMMPKPVQKPPPPPPPPVIKYPIEDMDCPPQREGSQRPALRFVTQSQQKDSDKKEDLIPAIEEQNVGLLLETWNTLNVYCQELLLDSFTFDDFVEALQWTSTEVECELLDEIHCAVLKKLVNDEKDMNGAIQIALPDLPEPEDSDEEDDEDEQEESRESSPTPEPDVPARRTRSSLNKMVLAEQERENSKADSVASEQVPHRASELFSEEYGWIQRLRKRDFQSGGWQVILAGLLHQVAGRPRLTQICERILTHLVPLEADPTVDTVIYQYSTMDINLRAQALQTICQLFLETKAVKKFLEEMAITMTQYRKKKIDHQRRRKEAIAILKKLHDERKILAPQELSPEPVEELEELAEAEKLAEADPSEIADSDDDSRLLTRSLRRGNDRAAERKRKRDEEAERKKREQEEKASKGSKEYQKILKSIDKEREKIRVEEAEIEVVDADLREADAYRTRCLGKDRFCNRYWWFERNAMPYSGLPNSSTSNAGYANGRLWVQGPDDMERIGYIDVTDEARNNYFRCFNMTPEQRKHLEEGETNLNFATQWGFFDEPEDLDKLILWLDSRGVRELKLKKELNIWRDKMEEYMIARLKNTNPDRAAAIEKAKLEKERLEDQEQDDTTADATPAPSANGVTANGTSKSASASPESEDEQPIPATTRMSTRTKTHQSATEDLHSAHRCLRWHNNAAVEAIGHRHIDPPQGTAKSKKAKGVAQKKGIAEIIPSATGARGTRNGGRVVSGKYREDLNAFRDSEEPSTGSGFTAVNGRAVREGRGTRRDGRGTY